MAETEQYERRAFKRFPVREGAFAVINEGGKLGQIVDISRGGLSFKYIYRVNKKEDRSILDIFTAGGGFRSRNIPFKTVSDAYVDEQIQFSSVKMRRCGIQFQKLNLGQISQIDDFIHSHTYAVN